MSGEYHHPNYVRVWVILVILLSISVIGPMFHHRELTLITAFGIAVVKAYLVAANFMHLRFEKRLATYMLSTVLIFMFLLFAGVAPDVMKQDGWQWSKPEVKREVAEGLARMHEAEQHGGEEH